MHVPVPAAANAGDAAQNSKTDEGDPLGGFQPWIFKFPLPAHASPSQHLFCSGPCSYCQFALHPCCLPRDSEEIKFNKSIGGFWCCCLYLYHLLETKKILGPSSERLLEAGAGLWLLVGSGTEENVLLHVRFQSLPRIPPGLPHLTDHIYPASIPWNPSLSSSSPYSTVH